MSFVFDEEENLGLGIMHSAGMSGMGDEGDGAAESDAVSGVGGSGELGGGGVLVLLAIVRRAAVAAFGAGGAGRVPWLWLLRMCWRMEGTRGRRGASMSLELKRGVGDAAGAGARGNTGSARLRRRP